ncbi:MAG TPA: hypothetical protein VKR22_10570 [Acidimicrobiales bacterium]|nr:hypothetical protein [Acidimicrobiales bacterium]
MAGTGAGSAPRPMVCESCGASDPDLVRVHRIYLETDGESRVVGQRVLEDVEWWCLPCRTHYPHQELPGD